MSIAYSLVEEWYYNIENIKIVEERIHRYTQYKFWE